MSDKEKGVVLITGVGPGTGSSLVRRFSQGGYSIAMLARTEDRLRKLSDAHEDLYAYPCDVADLDALERTVHSIRNTLGAPEIVIHNAVGGAFGSFLQIDPAALERNFQVNTMALLHLARLTVPQMIEAGRGVILGTGNTSAYRGKANFAGFAPSKAAQRILLESIARHAGPMGIHAAYIAIDAVIDVPWARKMTPDKPDDFFCQPDDIAEECYHVAHQAKSAWSSEVIIRPFGEKW